MKKLLPVVCVVLLLGADKKDDGKKDEKQIQGTWTFVSGERGGKAIPDQDAKQIALTFAAGGKGTIKSKDGEKEVEYTLDPSKKPREITLKRDDKAILGIYELDGDTLKVCAVEEGNGKRPTKFETSDDVPKQILLTLKREKK